MLCSGVSLTPQGRSLFLTLPRDGFRAVRCASLASPMVPTRLHINIFLEVRQLSLMTFRLADHTPWGTNLHFFTFPSTLEFPPFWIVNGAFEPFFLPLVAHFRSCPGQPQTSFPPSYKKQPGPHWSPRRLSPVFSCPPLAPFVTTFFFCCESEVPFFFPPTTLVGRSAPLRAVPIFLAGVTVKPPVEVVFRYPPTVPFPLSPLDPFPGTC